MRFLLDQDVYALTCRFLQALGHDVITAAAIHANRAADTELLRIAEQQKRLLVTRDRDFGGLVFVGSVRQGVIYLRVLPSTLHAVHQELEKVLRSYSEAELSNAFVVVEPGRHRFRRLTQ